MGIQKIIVKLQPITESLKYKQAVVSVNKHFMIMVI